MNIHVSLAAEKLFELGPLVLTNSLLTGLVGSVLIFLLFWAAGRRMTLHPSGKLSQIVESIGELILDLMGQVMPDRAKAIRFFPLLMTLFIFILVNNWLGLLPGVGSIVVHGEEGIFPLFRGATADLSSTLALAVISVVMTQIYAVKELGLFTHLKKYISLNPVLLFVGVLEFMSEFSKMISFSFRLFGNIFAGEVLLVVMSALAPLLSPLPFYILEIFVGLVQALVFAMLTLVFLEIASSPHGDHRDEHHGRQEQQESRSPTHAHGAVERV